MQQSACCCFTTTGERLCASIHCAHSESTRGRGTSRYQRGDMAGALQDARVALELDADFVPAMCCSAAAAIRLGRLSEARLTLRRASQLQQHGYAADVAALTRRLGRAAAAEALQRAACGSSGDGGQEPVVTLSAAGASSASPSSSSCCLSPPTSRCHKALILTRGGGKADRTTMLDPTVFPAGLRAGGLENMHIFQPSADGIDTNLLILLHGLGVREPGVIAPKVAR